MDSDPHDSQCEMDWLKAVVVVEMDWCVALVSLVKESESQNDIHSVHMSSNHVVS